MKALGSLLGQGRPGERAEFSAAFVVGAMNQVLEKNLRLAPVDARAQTFFRQTITIGVAHGAIAGLIQQSADELIAAANTKLQTTGATGTRIKKILTRPMTSPSP